MVDTNIIISASIFPNSTIGNVFAHIINNHELVLCKYILKEIEIVFYKKFSDRIKYLKKFIKDLKYELLKFEITDFNQYPRIRDINDIPVLAYAIESKVDILLTGDKDFDNIKIGNLKIINPRKYIEEYMKTSN